jgi:hypothetical protein
MNLFTSRMIKLIPGYLPILLPEQHYTLITGIELIINRFMVGISVHPCQRRASPAGFIFRLFTGE